MLNWTELILTQSFLETPRMRLSATSQKRQTADYRTIHLFLTTLMHLPRTNLPRDLNYLQIRRIVLLSGSSISCVRFSGAFFGGYS